MTTWRLLKRDDEDSKFWAEVGTHQSEHDWSIGWDAAKQIGSIHGKGEYLLLANERFKELVVAERSEFYEVVDEPEELEPVSLKAAPSAADVMSREG